MPVNNIKLGIKSPQTWRVLGESHHGQVSYEWYIVSVVTEKKKKGKYTSIKQMHTETTEHRYGSQVSFSWINWWGWNQLSAYIQWGNGQKQT